MIIDDQLLQELLSRAKQLRRTEEISFNPMSEFVPYVSTKEIVHSKIICELLNPHGSHGCEDEFLKSFFEQFLPNLRFEDYSDFNVTLERKVTRVLTEGGVRSIDILVNFKDSCGKNHAIILENKLNHAEFQYLQIEDYIAGLVYEGIKVDHVVILHDRYQHCTASDNSISTTLLYPNQLSDWIKSVNNENSGIDAYADYLMLLHNQNISYENSKNMLNLSLQEIKDLYKLKEAFENLTDAKNKYILGKVSAKLQPLSVEHTFSKLDEGCKLFQLWIQEDYKKMIYGLLFIHRKIPQTMKKVQMYISILMKKEFETHLRSQINSVMLKLVPEMDTFILKNHIMEVVLPSSINSRGKRCCRKLCVF